MAKTDAMHHGYRIDPKMQFMGTIDVSIVFEQTVVLFCLLYTQNIFFNLFNDVLKSWLLVGIRKKVLKILDMIKSNMFLT